MAQEELYQQLAAAIGVSDSRIIPEIFKMLADENEARVLLAASPPATVEELAEKTGLPAAEVGGMMDPLFKKGLIYTSSKGGPVRYYRVRQLLQFHDAAILAPGVPQRFYDLWKEYHRTEFMGHHKRIEAALPRPVIRVIPINVTMQPDARVAAFDDVRRIVDAADTLAVTKCTCRVIDGSCGKPLEVCIQVNKAADYSLRRGTGRKLTKQEALDMLKMCEEAGLVHCVGNSRALGHIICNCCSDCCINWPGPRSEPNNFTAPSRFAAQVNPDLCIACETCLDRCYFEAIFMDEAGDSAVIKEESCMGCGLCVVTCPSGALTLKEVRNEDFVPV